MNIFARHRFDASDVTRESDFLSFHEKTTLFEEIWEPPFLTHLALLYNRSSIEDLRSLAKSTIRFSTLHQKSQQTWVFKGHPGCTKIVPFIHSALPSVQHFFVSRKNSNDLISRLILSNSTEFQYPIFSFLLKFGQFLDISWISGWKEMELEVFTRICPKNDLEFSMAQVYGSILNYRRNRQYFVQEMPFVEDLISDTATHIRPLLDLCEISDLAIPECIEWKRNAEEQIQQTWDTVDLSADDVTRVDYLAEQLQQDVFF
uniref:F-box domain-containing protein n=1 Tax=Caenorhabditis tropicalis TaxID=1561998 RepID=A0A1I7U4F6_9PELO